MDSRAVVATVAVIGIPLVLVGYIVGIEKALTKLPARVTPRLRPWAWLLPALAFLMVFLVYPVIQTIVLSFQDRASDTWVGLANYEYVFTSPETLTAMRNNVLWLVFFTASAVGLGLLIAVLFDRLRFESAFKTVIFVPLAISFVAAGVIWQFMFAYEPPGSPQTGTLNAVLAIFGIAPVGWLLNSPLNTFALIAVGVWMWTGFCMVILSAALKGISAELLEAARTDGASEWQVFRLVIVPLLLPTIAVVATTMVIVSLKTFDIVYVMTNGAFDTDVIANQMYQEMFNFGQFGRASAIAVVLLLATVPVMGLNIRRFREQEAQR